MKTMYLLALSILVSGVSLPSWANGSKEQQPSQSAQPQAYQGTTPGILQGIQRNLNAFSVSPVASDKGIDYGVRLLQQEESRGYDGSDYRRRALALSLVS